MMSKRGYVYTIISLVFALVLLAVISLYYESYRNTAEIAPAKIRTDELHYFVESCKKDLSRAMVISGRRAAVYMVDYVVNNSRPLDDPEQGLREMLINGTLTVGGNTKNITYMKNHTLNVWLGRFQDVSRKLNFESNISFVSIDIYHYDAWNFMEVLTLSFNVSDKKTISGSMCSYENQNVKIYSLVPLEGVEDALYPLKTANKVKRYITAGGVDDIDDTEALGSGQHGRGTGGGIVFDVSAEANPGPNITEYNSTRTQLVPYTLFVMDYGYGGFPQEAKDVLKLSGGVINYRNQALDTEGFPYVSGLARINFSLVDHAAFKNKGLNHTVFKLRISDYLYEKLYHTSADGPCFFDRLGLRLNLSEKYVNQSRDIRSFFGMAPDPQSGLEGYVNVSEFAQFLLYDYGILPDYNNQSSVDYKYFNNTRGLWLCGTPYWFRMDVGHGIKYNLTRFCCERALAGYWMADEWEGNNVYDESRDGNTGTFQGPAWSTGKNGAALKFTGTNSVTVPDSEGLDATGDLSITMWIKPDAAQKNSADILSKHGPGGYAIEQDGAHTNEYHLVWDATGTGGWTGGGVVSSLTPGVWQHYAIVKSGGDVTHYVNGKIKASGTVPETAISVNGLPLVIGKYAGSGGGREFSGEIDELRIWRVALGAGEITEEYQSYP